MAQFGQAVARRFGLGLCQQRFAGFLGDDLLLDQQLDQIDRRIGRCREFRMLFDQSLALGGRLLGKRTRLPLANQLIIKTQRVGSLLAGSTNSFKVIRDGKEQIIRVTVRARDDKALASSELDPARAGMKPPTPSDSDAKVLGGTIRTLTAEEATKFDVGAAGTGLIVVTVEARGAFSKADIFPGDVILEINNKVVKAPKDYEDAIAAAKSAGKKDVIARVGCGNQERCFDLTVLRPIEIAPAE